jgi:serine protease AprX
MTRLLNRRRTLTAVLTALSLLLPLGASQAGANIAQRTAVVDQQLLAAVAHGTAPAVLSWDEKVTSREQVASYLRSHGIAFSAFSVLPMAVTCAATAEDVLTLSHAPGAVSVYGDEKMVPAVKTGALPGKQAAAALRTPLSVPGATGDNVGIAVLDTGIDGNHADLKYGTRTLVNARVILSHMEILGPGNDNCVPNEFQEGIPDSESISGHGTHLAGVAAGDGTASGGQVKGVAPAADLVGVSVVEHSTPQVVAGDSTTGTVTVSLIRFLAGVNYILMRALDGGPTITKVALLGWTSEGLFDPWHPHTLAISDLHAFGISPVVPVGNGGTTQSRCDQASTCHFNRLAVGNYAIGVGATRQTAAGQVLADYSSAGDSQLREARDELVRYEPMLVAPGTNILGARRVGVATFTGSASTPYPLAGQGAGADDDVTNVNYQAMTGTSVAAAQVAGSIALMQQAARDAKGCYLSVDQVQEILRQTATPMAGYARWQVGYGSINAEAAVTAAREASRIASPDPWMCPG